MSVDIAAENAQSSTYAFNDMWPQPAQGDMSVAGFARQISVNVGETVTFSVNGPATVIRIFRAGYYSDGKGFREVASITNTPTTQPAATVIPGSNGATTCTGWSVTASWAVPVGAVSGMYMAMIRNAANDNAFHATFVVRDDAAVADIIYKTSDSTWASAYNHFGTISAPDGGNVYGFGTGVGNIMSRTFATSYHRPVITRGGVMQTYWWACELPLIRFLERNGFKVKYVTSVDLDKQGRSLLRNKGSIFISSGHDEYWSGPMRTAVETWRDSDAGRSIFMSGNEVFWKSRYVHNGDESTLWTYKDTMPGPSGYSRSPGQPLDPVEWTGTWMDTRWPDHKDGALLTGTKFGMNGVYDYDATIPKNPYGGLKVWGGSALVDAPVTLTAVMGFEADHLHPTQPTDSTRILASYTRSAPGGLSDANGELYNVSGNIEWGIISQRYAGGGLTVGFGTCQWAWALDGTHDRGSTPVSLAAQQFTVNLLRDLGAVPATPMGGVTVRPQNSLDEYGAIPGNPSGGGGNDPGDLGDPKWRLYDGSVSTLWTKIGGLLVLLQSAPAVPVPDPDPGRAEYPNATNTGYLNNVASLANMEGTTITTPGTVIQGKNITGTLWIEADNVTIRNCVINAEYYGVFFTDRQNILIEDCTIVGGDNCGALLIGSGTIRRCNIHGGDDGLKIGGSMLVQDCYIHDLVASAEAHNDSIQCSDGNGLKFIHNWLESPDTSNIAMFEGQGTWSDVLIQDNVFAGAPGWHLYLGGSTATNVRVINNKFKPGGYGYATDIPSGLVSSGNTRYDNGSPITL